MFGNVLTGTVLVENIFSWPGIGQYAYHAATISTCRRSWASACSSRSSTSSINFVVDILYGVIDPRIRHRDDRARHPSPGQTAAAGCRVPPAALPGAGARRS